MAFKDPLDEEADAAEGKIVGNHAEKLSQRMNAAREEDTEAVSVEPDEPDDDEEDAVVEPTRRDKRANRTTARERAAAAEARAEAYREALTLSGRDKVERGAPPPQANQLAGIDGLIRKNYADQEQLHNEYNARVRAAGERGLSADEEQKFKDRAIDLDVANKTLVADRRDAVRAPARAEEARVASLKARAPDVYENEKAFQYARGFYNQEIARGVPDTLELHDASMEEARRVILGKRPKPDAAQRQRMTGLGGGTRAPSRDAGATTISMPKGSHLYRMAIARYPDLEPAQACQKWAQRSGKQYLERTAGKR